MSHFFGDCSRCDVDVGDGFVFPTQTATDEDLLAFPPSPAPTVDAATGCPTDTDVVAYNTYVGYSHVLLYHIRMILPVVARIAV